MVKRRTNQEWQRYSNNMNTIWLFANNPNGAKASTMLYSIVMTAKTNDLTFYDYMVKRMK